MRKLLFRVGVELFFWSCCLAIVLMIDPTRASWGFNANPISRYLIVILALASWILMLLAGARIPLNWQAVTMTMFILLMLGGTLFTIFTSRNNNLMSTWLGRGLSALVFFPAYHVSSNSGSREFMTRRLSIALKTGYVLMILILWGIVLKMIYRDLSQVYHTEATLLLATGWWWLLTSGKDRVWSAILLLGTVAGLIVIGKFTSYALITMSLGIFVLQRIINTRVKHISPGSQKLLTAGIQLVSILTIVISLFLSLNEIAGARSSARESLVRDYTFALRFEMFQNSPYLGTLFTGNPLVTIGGMTAPLPSHSDWLDIAAFSGVIGLSLFLFPAVNLLWKTLQKNSRGWESDRANKLPIFCLYYVALSFVVMVANPLLGVPSLALWLWFSLGTLLAYARA